MPEPLRHILIVEDHAEVRRLLRSGIESLGPEMRVMDVPSAEEGILMLTRQKIDLLITDVHLPGISGLELKQKAGKRSPGMKLIFITGITDPKVRSQVAEAGADAYFYKPLQLSEFLLKVEECLGRRLESAAARPPQTAEPQKAHAAAPVGKTLEELRASWAVWFHLKGKVLAHSGRYSESTLDNGLAPLIQENLAALSRLSRFFDRQAPQDFLLLQAPGLHLMLSHVGATTALLAAFADEPGEHKLERDITSFRTAVQALAAARPPGKGREGKTLDGPQKPSRKQAPATKPLQPVAQPEQDTQSLTDVFQQASQQKGRAADVDAYWETAADQGEEGEHAGQDTLTFEEARRMGLAPEE